MANVLSDARQLLAETDQKIRDPTLTATETAWVAINFADKMSVMLPEMVAYAEMREAQAIEAMSRYLMTSNNDRAIYEGIGQIKSNEDFMERAAKELSADLLSWHKITEEEKAAIGSILNKYEQFGKDFWFDEEELKVLRGLIQ